jgi:hypothetical protein
MPSGGDMILKLDGARGASCVWFGAAVAQGTLGVSSTSLWTVFPSFEGHTSCHRLSSPRCYRERMLPAYLVRQPGHLSHGESAAARVLRTPKRAL